MAIQPSERSISGSGSLRQPTVLRRPHDVLIPLPAEQNPFVGVEDASLQLFFQDLHKIVEKEFRTWPIPASTLFNDISYQTVFHLKRTSSSFGDINWLLAEVRRKKILVELPRTETTDRYPRLDKERVYAFGALTWAIQQMYPRRYKRGNLVEIPESGEEFPWDAVIERAKEGLGKSHLASLINNPVAA